MSQNQIKPTLLVLAAGMGSRYGGLKQVDPVGPHGETIIDYSIYDAMRAGFGKLVFIIRHEIEEQFKQIVGSRFENRIEVAYAFQELDKLPTGFAVPAGRSKPWGTTHAIWMASDIIREPFAAINGDDFYGRESYQLLAEHLRGGSRDQAMVGFILRNTLSDFGSVARGICDVDHANYLRSVIEMTQIVKDGSGARNTDADGKNTPLSGEEAVSMNMWGFTPDIFDALREQFTAFLSQNGQDMKAECYIPSTVAQLVRAGTSRVKVLRTPSSWFGVTYKEDKPTVVQSIRALIAQGDYPENLWS